MPAKTPQAIVARLNKDVIAAMALPGMSESLAAQGLDAAAGPPEPFAKLIASEIATYKKLVRAAGIKID